MRRDLGDRLGVIKIVPILKALTFGDLGLGGDDPAGFPHDPAHRVAHRGHLADCLRQDVADAFDNLFDRINSLVGIHEFLGRRGQIGERLVAGPDPEGQRFQPAVACVRGFGALLGLERKVKVLEPLGIVGRANRGGQVGYELALGVDRLEDRLLPLGQLAQRWTRT